MSHTVSSLVLVRTQPGLRVSLCCLSCQAHSLLASTLDVPALRRAWHSRVRVLGTNTLSPQSLTVLCMAPRVALPAWLPSVALPAWLPSEVSLCGLPSMAPSVVLPAWLSPA